MNSSNPDILAFIADLSSDEIFTPPSIVSQMLDLLPEKCWSDPDVTFLDPCCKSGIFLRDIAKRLLSGLSEKIPDLQERINHICQKQIHGIAITELTALLSRRSLYCSKYANGKYSICNTIKFGKYGNVLFTPSKHQWTKSGTCEYCKANKSNFNRSNDLESHAYQFLHTSQPEEIFKMKFDVIVGNPPYHLDTGGHGRQAKPIYDQFVEQAKKLNPKYIVMIIPSRWFASGMGLDKFRENMLHDQRVRQIVDFPNSRECFPSGNVSGGVCYFLWDRAHIGDCEIVNIRDGTEISRLTRPLDEFFPILIRYNKAVPIIRKISKIGEKSVSSIVSPTSPFGLPTNTRGDDKKSEKAPMPLHSSNGVSYIPKSVIQKGEKYLDKYKVLVGQGGDINPTKDGKFSIIPRSMKIICPGEVCTDSYLVIGPTESSAVAKNICEYLKTKFARFLILQAMTSFHLPKSAFSFVPIQDFSKSWRDQQLYNKYNLTHEEIDYIESIIKPFGADEE